MATKALEDLRKKVSSQRSRDTLAFSTEIIDKLKSVLCLITATSTKTPTQAHLLSFQELFTKEIGVLYEAHPSLTLKLVSLIVTDLFKLRLSPLLKLEISKERFNQLGTWEDVLRSILNGVQTYIDGNKADMVEIGRALYKPFFAVLGSPLGLNLSARIRTQAYSLLADVAADCAGNRVLLRQKTILGGIRLGGIIASTNEYLVLDALFQLLARITPSSSDVTGRANLAKDVFQNAGCKRRFGQKTCNELASLLRSARGDQWEKATDQIITSIARADKKKPQPFRLMSNKIHANSFEYLHPPSLDRIYLDCGGLVINIQDGDSIDCLEVDYGSIASIKLQGDSGNESENLVLVSLLLSSPPLKGLAPVMDPQESGTTSHRVTFDISVKDSEGFKAALQFRGIGSLIHQVRGSSSKVRNSILARGPLDLNSLPMASLEEKSREVETFYATCSSEDKSPGQKLSKTRQGQDSPWIHLDVAMADTTVIPGTSRDPLPETTNEISHIDTQEGSKVIAGGGEVIQSVPDHRPSKLIDDGDKPLTDLESFSTAEIMLMNKSGEKKPISHTASDRVRPPGAQKSGTKNLSKGRISQRPEEKPLVIDCNIQTISKPSKRKRAVEDSADDECGNGKAQPRPHYYNSQLLKPRETATTRSTTRYTARNKKPSPSPSFSDTDFDAIPPTTRASIPASKSKPSSNTVLLHSTKASNRTHGDLNSAGKDKDTNTSKPSGKSKQKTAGDGPAVSSRPKRSRKKIRFIESGDESDDPTPIIRPVSSDEHKDRTLSQDVASINPPIPPLIMTAKTGNKTEMMKRPPWKNLVQMNPVEDGLGSSAVNIRSDAETQNTAGRSSEQSEAQKEQPEAKAIPFLHPDLPVHVSPLPPARFKLEPLELDLAVAQAENFDMDVDFDLHFDPVASVAGNFPPTTPTITHKKVNSDHVVSGTGAVPRSGHEYPEPLTINESSHPSPKRAVNSKVYDINETWNLSVSPLRFSPERRATRHHDTIDLTGVDDADLKDLTTDMSIQTRRERRNTPQRPTVTFAHDTKGSPTKLPRAASMHKQPNVKAKSHSLIPRLRVRRELSEDITAPHSDIKRTQKLFGSHYKMQLPAVSCRSLQPTRPSPIDHESEDDESEGEMNADQRIVVVLNKIQEVIIGNMNNKFNGAAMRTRAATEGLRLFAAEELREMRNKSGQHRENLMRLEERYASFGRDMRNCLEEQDKTSKEIDRRLRQAVLDHDKHGLSRNMPSKLPPRPKIFQSLLG